MKIVEYSQQINIDINLLYFIILCYIYYNTNLKNFLNIKFSNF